MNEVDVEDINDNLLSCLQKQFDIGPKQHLKPQSHHAATVQRLHRYQIRDGVSLISLCCHNLLSECILHKTVLWCICILVAVAMHSHCICPPKQKVFAVCLHCSCTLGMTGAYIYGTVSHFRSHRKFLFSKS